VRRVDALDTEMDGDLYQSRDGPQIDHQWLGGITSPARRGIAIESFAAGRAERTPRRR
jgi:hypothetical protein